MIISMTFKLSGDALRVVQAVQKEYKTTGHEALSALISAGAEFNSGDDLRYHRAEGVEHVFTEADRFDVGETVGYQAGNRVLYGKVTGHRDGKVILFLTENSRKSFEIHPDTADNYEAFAADVFHL